MTTLFISDLHLCKQRPDITEMFKAFLDDKARHARALYILGDLFEYWLGDDALDETAEIVSQWLKELNSLGVEIYYMAGNRDFLLGESYANKSGMKIINEPHLIELNGEQSLLIHGDAECTDDKPYQQARLMLRNPAWQVEFLSKSIAERIAFAEQARKQSQEHTQGADMNIMDVNQNAIDALFEQHNVKQMIHGHTHRPAIHERNDTKRIVLGDWHKQASYLEYNDSGMSLVHA
ncbi:UDP-2,3-diacylglucosamine diphosphatase [Marinicella rhabdoformis]|uniref:UDP-2,3-diacylglucosamine diphosphatase n=1 Tax=Marinicella rhabdoformis TaxID=2580566 RepID=UPI0012AEBB2A|nr:UDP-2,3-diacylglucosamine diphosphatase [Marinicella rhabdoformis]